MVINQSPVIVDLLIPFIVEEQELTAIPSKSTVLKGIIMRNTLKNIFPVLGTPAGTSFTGSESTVSLSTPMD